MGVAEDCVLLCESKIFRLFILWLQVYNGQQWIQQYLATVRSTSDSEVNNLHTFLTETFLVPMQFLAHQLQLQEAENQALNQMIVNQVCQEVQEL